MKIRLVALLLLAGTLLAAQPEIEFVGVLGSGRETRVALKTKSSDQTRWVSVGQTFAGYTVASFDPKAEAVTLTRDGQQVRVPLRQARVAAGTAEAPPEIKKAVLNNLRQLAAAADQFYLENGRTTVNYDQLVGTDKYVKAINAIAGENYRAIEFVQGRTLRVTTSAGHAVSYNP